MRIQNIVLLAILLFCIILIVPKSPQGLYQGILGKIIRPLCVKSWASRLAGWYCSTKISAWHIKGFIKRHNIDMNESEKSVSKFSSFNDFFTRRLKANARSINKNLQSFISPADCFIMAQENIRIVDTFPIKKSEFNLATCLNNQKLAQKYDGGTLIICRLAPWHYHRFHFPCSARATQLKKIPGIYESVNPLVYCLGIQPLEVNERGIIHLQRTNKEDILFVPVGALFVGSIITTYTAGTMYKKGEEMGYFSFGGSTILIVIPRETIVMRPDILAESKKGREIEVRMGESIGTLID